jgi:hypothetical protein
MLGVSRMSVPLRSGGPGAAPSGRENECAGRALMATLYDPRFQYQTYLLRRQFFKLFGAAFHI